MLVVIFVFLRNTLKSNLPAGAGAGVGVGVGEGEVGIRVAVSQESSAPTLRSLHIHTKSWMRVT